MKITVINGTEIHGVTDQLKNIFLESFRESAEIAEFYLPKDCPNFCAGCKTCFQDDENNCKDRAFTRPIEQALLEADLLVFTSPAYVGHATGAMKTLLDHFGFRWMPHRPATEMFSKRAILLTQCLGAGARSTAKDIKDSLSWWGVSSIKILSFRLMSEVFWEKLSAKKRAKMAAKLQRTARRLQAECDKTPRVRLATKVRFYATRIIHKTIDKKYPTSPDSVYWNERGWMKKETPWKKK